MTHDRDEGFGDDMVDRILRGQGVPDEVPGALAEVAELMRLAIAAPLPADPAREERIVAAMAAAHPGPGRLRRRAVLVGAALAGFSLTGGLAAAGALPAPAQDAASAMLDRVGLSVPDSDGNRGRAAKAEAEQEAEERKTAGGAGNGNGAGDDGPPDGSTTGGRVSGVARDTEPGPDHGDTVCAEASAERCDDRGSSGRGPNDDDDDDVDGDSDGDGRSGRPSPTTPPASSGDDSPDSDDSSDDSSDDRSGHRAGESSIDEHDSSGSGNDHPDDSDEEASESSGTTDDDHAGARS